MEDWSLFEPVSLKKSNKYFLRYNVILSSYDPQTKTLRKLEETLKKLMADETGWGFNALVQNQLLKRMNSMENLPIEITENILSRLPKVFQFQSRQVCKTWQTLVPKPKTGLLYGVSHRKATTLETQFYFSEENNAAYLGALTNLEQCVILQPLPCYKIFMVGSCHGLVCYAAYSSYATSRKRICDDIKVYICNPVTGEQIQLPTVNNWHTFAEQAIGFGYNRSSNEYKVVRILLDSKYHRDGTIQVYTLQDGTVWRNSKSTSTVVKRCFKPHEGRVAPIPSVGVFAGGALHWFDRCSTERTTVLAFDLEHETFKLLPSILSAGCDANVGLMVLGGNLCVLQVVSREPVMVWELRDRKKRRLWLKKFRIPRKDWSWLKAFALPKSDKYFLCHNVIVSCYDPETKTLINLEETLKKFLEDSTPPVYTTTRATPFMHHSLVSLKT